MITIPNLDMFIAQTCNLSCAGCQTLSDSKAVKGITRYNAEYVEFWSDKIQPVNINMFGGEPLLNPDLEQWLSECRKHWPTSNLVIQTNGIRLTEQHLQWVDDYSVSINISQHMPEYRNTVWNFINSAIDTGKFEPWTNENGPVQNGYGEQRGWINSNNCHIQLTESFAETVWWSFYKGTAETSTPNHDYFSNDFKSSWDVCGCRSFVNMFEGNLYKCPAVAGLLINGESLGLNEKTDWKGWFDNYKCLHLHSDDATIQEWFEDQQGPQSCCNMCARELDMHNQTEVNTKVKLK